MRPHLIWYSSLHTHLRFVLRLGTPLISGGENLLNYQQLSRALPDCVEIWYRGALWIRRRCGIVESVDWCSMGLTVKAQMR